MTPPELDDPILERVRRARPAPPAGAEVRPVDAHQQLVEIIRPTEKRHHRRGRARQRITAALVPSLGVAVVIAMAGFIIAVNARHHTTAAAAGERGTRLTAREFAVAVGFGTAVPGFGSDAATRLLFDAEQQLRARCMSRRGLGYQIEQLPSVGRLPSFTGYPTTFYPSPTPGPYPESALLAERTRNGFGIYRNANTPRIDPDPEDRYVASLSRTERASWLRAWTGPHGCLSEAAASIYGSRRGTAKAESLSTIVYNHLVAAVYSSSGAPSAANQKTAEAAAAWSRCVRAHVGRSFDDEAALVAWLQNTSTTAEQQTAGFRQREVRYALMSTRCAYSSGQAQAFAAAFRAAANRLPANIVDQLQFVIAHQASWIARARAALKKTQA